MYTALECDGPRANADSEACLRRAEFSNGTRRRRRPGCGRNLIWRNRESGESGEKNGPNASAAP
jgi:hypothetical protein